MLHAFFGVLPPTCVIVPLLLGNELLGEVSRSVHDYVKATPLAIPCANTTTSRPIATSLLSQGRLRASNALPFGSTAVSATVCLGHSVGVRSSVWSCSSSSRITSFRRLLIFSVVAVHPCTKFWVRHVCRCIWHPKTHLGLNIDRNPGTAVQLHCPEALPHKAHSPLGTSRIRASRRGDGAAAARIASTFPRM